MQDTITFALVFCIIVGEFSFLAVTAELNIQVHNSKSSAQGYSDYPNDDQYKQIADNVDPLEDIESYFYIRGFETAGNDEMLHLSYHDVIHAC